MNKVTASAAKVAVWFNEVTSSAMQVTPSVIEVTTSMTEVTACVSKVTTSVKEAGVLWTEVGAPKLNRSKRRKQRKRFSCSQFRDRRWRDEQAVTSAGKLFPKFVGKILFRSEVEQQVSVQRE